jgi:cytochrome c-type biogenesis protein CcmE
MSAVVTDRRRRRAFFAVGLCGVAVVAIVALAVVLSENVVYFRTVSEAVADRRAQGHDRFRLAGQVVPGSIVETAKGVRFRVTDGKATATILHVGDPPDLFKPGAPVVCEGRWGAGRAFDSDRIMIRHGNDYRPPKVNSQRAVDRG